MQKEEKRVIDKNVFWAVVFASEANGGVGSGDFYEAPEGTKPLCVYGMAMEAKVPTGKKWSSSDYYDTFGQIFPSEFDQAVRDVREERTGERYSQPGRVPVLEVFERLGIEPSE